MIIKQAPTLTKPNWMRCARLLSLLSLFALLASPASGGAQCEAYETARANFSVELRNAQMRGIGISSYEKYAKQIDLDEQNEEGSGLTRLLELRRALQKQLTEVERENFEPIGNKILADILQGLSHARSKGRAADIEFIVGKDLSITGIKWLKRSNDPVYDKAVAETVSTLSRNLQAPTQEALPIKVRLETGPYPRLQVFDAKTRKLRYLVLYKPPCFK